MAPLLNTLASTSQLSLTPSRADGIPQDLEEELRVYGCQLIQSAGVLLRLPQVAMATAQVLFQRFWYVTSMKHFSTKDIGMGALFLAAKLEEAPLRIRDLINVYDYLIQRALHHSKHRPGPRALEKRGGSAYKNSASHPSASHPSLPARPGLGSPQRAASPSQPSEPVPPFCYSPPAYFAQSFYDTKDALVIAEMQILKRLGFNVQVNLPYATAVNYLQVLGLADSEQWPEAPQRAWGYLNDALQTPVYCLYPPHVLAVASIYLTSLTSSPPIPLPLHPQPWYTLFDATLPDIRSICGHIMRLYHQNGIRGRVREEWGGLVELSDKKDVREWMEWNREKLVNVDGKNRERDEIMADAS